MHATARPWVDSTLLALALGCLLAGGTALRAQEPTWTGGVAPNEAPIITDEKVMQEHLLNVVNQYRFERGLDALNLNERLSVIAKKHAIAMMQTGYLYDFDFSDRWLEAKAANKRLLAFAENNAFVFPTKGVPGHVLQEWAKRPDHNRNLLDRDFVETGIGFALDRDGNVFVCQNFARLRPVPAGKPEMAMQEEMDRQDSTIEVTEKVNIGVQDLQ